MGDVGKRPFWMHQLAEYVLGAALAAIGLRSPTPIVPGVVAAMVILHAAITKGPLSAFQVLGRKSHRAVDVAIIGFEVLAAVQPVFSVEASTRFIMGLIALVHAFIWWQTKYAERPKRVPRPVTNNELVGDRSNQIGRTAGRVVGTGVNMAKRAKSRRGR